MCFAMDLSERKKWIILIVYAFLIACFVCAICDDFSVKNYMNTRLRHLADASQALQAGNLASFLADMRDHNVPYYLYLSYLGKGLGIDEAHKIFFIVQQTAMFLAIFLTPLFLYRMGFLYLNAILSAPVFSACIYKGFLLYKNDSYWSLGWCLFLVIPLLALAYREGKFNKKSTLLILLAGIIIGAGNLPRMHAGLAAEILLCCVIFILARKHMHLQGINGKTLIGGIFLLGISMVNYFLFVQIIPNIYTQTHCAEEKIESFGPWHTLYIGLGWDNSKDLKFLAADNPYHIFYKDECAFNFVKSVDSEVKYVSKNYFKILQTEYLHILKSDPIFFIASYVKKFIVCIGQGIIELWRLKYLFILAGAVFLLLRYRFHQRDILKKYHVIFAWLLFCFLFNCIFGLIAVPGKTYLLGSIAAADLAVFFYVLAATERSMHLLKEKFVNG